MSLHDVQEQKIVSIKSLGLGQRRHIVQENNMFIKHVIATKEKIERN